jgi:hypothetical protein
MRQWSIRRRRNGLEAIHDAEVSSDGIRTEKAVRTIVIEAQQESAEFGSVLI